jgi:hypothetical protein
MASSSHVLALSSSRFSMSTCPARSSLPRPGAGRPGQPRPQGGGKDQGGAGSTGHSAPAGERSAGLAAPPPAGHYGLLSPRLHPCDVPQKPSTPQLKTIHQGKWDLRLLLRLNL